MVRTVSRSSCCDNAVVLSPILQFRALTILRNSSVLAHDLPEYELTVYCSE